jgi:hypothetical protein
MNGPSHPADLFLRNHDGIEPLIADVECEAPELAERVPDAIE